VENLDIIEMRRRPPHNRFERKLSGLTFQQVNAIGEYLSFAQAAAENGNIEQIIHRVSGAQHSLAEIEGQLRAAVELVNKNLPFVFPLQVNESSKMRIWHLQDRIRVLAPDMLLLRMTTDHVTWRHFVLQRARGSRGFHMTVVTLSSIFCFMRLMLNDSYCARSRNLVIFPTHFFEVGTDTMIAVVGSRARTLETLFIQLIGLTEAEWTATFLNSNSRSFEGRDMKLTDAGRSNIETFPNDGIRNSMIRKLSARGYLSIRSQFARSIGVSSVIGHFFNVPYPTLCRELLARDSIPLLHSAFDTGRITSLERPSFASFRMSPNIVVGLGSALQGDLTLTMALVAKALVSNLECLRASIEAIISDEDVEAGRPEKTPEQLLTARAGFERRVIQLAPPKISSRPEAGKEWLTDIEKLIAYASDSSKQPPEAIPWF
jgi:hypothetical protein